MKRFLMIAAAVGLTAAISLWIHYSATTEEYQVSGAYKALLALTEARAYPHEDIPDQANYAAFEYVQQNFIEATSKTGATDTWEARGPHNLGGRTLAVAFNPQNPNTIYAGSASGGLWRSYTGGIGAAAWEYIATGFPVSAVSSVTFAPNDSNTIYIGTGEVYNYQAAGTGAAYRSTRGTYGIGILKSGDGGQTWTKSLDWSSQQKRGVWAVKVNPLNPNTVWAATTEGTYKSTDAGQSWELKHAVVMGNDLVIHPVDTNTVVATYGNFGSPGHGIYRSADGGESWTQSTQGLPTTFLGKAMLDISASDPNTVYASIGNGFSVGSPNNASWLCRSQDGGITWTQMSTTDYSLWQGWFSHDVAVNPTDVNEVIAIGITVWKSTSGGSNLVGVSSGGLGFAGQVPPGDPEGPPGYTHSDQHDVVYHPTNPSIIYFANDGGVFRSTDGAQTFEGCNGGYQTSQFYAGFAASLQDSNLAIGGFQDNSTAIYFGTTAWSRFQIGGDGAWAGVHATDDNVLFGSAQVLQAFRSENQGSSWPFNITPAFTSGPSAFIAPYVLGINSPDVVYAGRDVVYRSTDRGDNWTVTNNGAPLDGNPVFAMALSPLNSDVVYAATAPAGTQTGVWRTTDAGASWQNITGTLPNRFPGDIAVDPIDEATVYITFLGFASPKVFRSSDYGTNWADITNGLPDVPTNAITVDPLNTAHLYVGNDLGIFVSTNGGQNWASFNEGLPDAVLAFDLVISEPNRKLWVATHGNGAWQRSLLDPSTGIDDQPVAATTFLLQGNYPNPFNPETVIQFELEHSSRMTLQIFDLLGRQVRTLLNNQQVTAGSSEVRWDGRDDRGLRVASGQYIYRLSDGRQQQSRMMTLAR